MAPSFLEPAWPAGALFFVTCKVKNPIPLTAETFHILQLRMTLCPGPGAPVTLGRLLPVSEPQFPTTKWGHGLPRAYLAQLLAKGVCSVNGVKLGVGGWAWRERP